MLEQRKGSYGSADLWLPFLLFQVDVAGKGKEMDMESLWDVKRAMEREIKKGSSPLRFDRLEFGSEPFHIITSEEKLDEVLAWLLRVKSFRQYAEKAITNNVYMDLDMLCRKPQFKRTHSALEREGIYARVQGYKRRLQPDYDSGLCLETVQCVFRLPEEEAERYRMIYNGKETYAFIMSNKYIFGLFTCCEVARKYAVVDGAEYGHLSGQEQRIVQLDKVGDVLFQALLLDDVEFRGNQLCASLYTIYCLNEKG